MKIKLLSRAYQSSIGWWLRACFGRDIAADKVERGDRLLEEVFELLQSGGYDPARIVPLRDYVWGRPPGDPPQEVGGVMVTLAAYCEANVIDMEDAANAELDRISVPAVMERIREKQKAKPVGSALPVAVAARNGAPEADIDRFNHIIDSIEARCMAVDGPVTPTLQEMEEAELSELWAILQRIKVSMGAGA